MDKTKDPRKAPGDSMPESNQFWSPLRIVAVVALSIFFSELLVMIILFFQSYLGVAGIIVVVLDTEGRVQLINRRGCEILDYREDEILGKKWIDHFVPERIKDELSFAFRAVLAGDLETAGYYENPVLTRRGEERTILWHNTVLTEQGRVVNTLSSGEDQTERKLTEKALKESETRYRLLPPPPLDTTE